MEFFYKRFFFLGLFACGIFFSFPQVSFSQSSLDSIQYLQEIVVTHRTYKEVIPAQKLTGVELQNLNSHSIADALRFFAGVQLKDYGGIGGIKTINIRSMGTHHVGVFYDGIQLGNAQNGIIDLGMYSLDNVDEISIYNGQRSEIFQSAKDFGSAGSLYVRSRKPKFKKGSTSNVKATIKAGSFDLINPSVLLENKFSDAVSSSFNAEWVNSSGKYKFRYRREFLDGTLAYDTTATRNNGDINAVRLEANLYGILNIGTWQLKGYNYTSERGIPGAIVNNKWRTGERMKDLNTFIQGSFRKNDGGKLNYMLNTKYAYYRTNYVNFNTAIEDDAVILENAPVNDIYRQKEFYASNALAYSVLKNWDISFAYDFQWNYLGSDRKEFVGPAIRYTNLISAATAFEVGRLKVQGSLLVNLVNDRIKKVNNPPFKDVYSPAVFLSYTPFRKHAFNIRAFYKKSFRMPTFNDLYYTDMGNAKLKPENATQYNVGVTYEKMWKDSFFSLFSMQVDGYYNWVKDKIVSYPKGTQFRWVMLNLGRVRIKGINASVTGKFDIIEDLSLTCKAIYTFERAIDLTKPSDNYYRHQIPYIPRNSGSFVAQGAYKDWRFNYSFIYVGERYNQQENIPVNYTQPWYTHDVSVAHDFKINGIRFSTSFEVNNLLSQDYDVILNFPMPKRNYKLIISAEF